MRVIAEALARRLGARGDRAMRRARRLGLGAVAPLDAAAARLNGKRPYPPLHLRRQVGPLATFESSAGEFAVLLSMAAGMRPGSSVLDVGCGCGSVPLALGDRLGPSGRYLGLDVDRAAIGWCRRHLAGEGRSFAEHDYWNAYYNPGGRRFLPFAVPDASIDVVLMKSVLTHVLPDDLTFNLREVARVLRPAGTALLTVFVYDESDAAVRTLCPYDAGAYRYRRESAPEAAIAFPEPWLRDQLAAAGLDGELRAGLWRGGSAAGPVFQDLLIVRRA